MLPWTCFWWFFFLVSSHVYWQLFGFSMDLWKMSQVPCKMAKPKVWKWPGRQTQSLKLAWEGLGVTSNSWYFVCLIIIIATRHGHLFGDLFCVFLYVSWKQVISRGFYSARKSDGGLGVPLGALRSRWAFRRPEAASNSWYFPGFKHMFATWHGHPFIFFVFSYVSSKQAITLGFTVPANYTGRSGRAPGAPR